MDKLPEDHLKEDGEGAPATLDSIPGMGAPVLPTATTAGSGDVPLGISKPKKSKRVKGYEAFIKSLEKE